MMKSMDVVRTKTTELAEFLSEGDWRFHSHYMVFGSIANVNGHLEGVNGGEIIGDIVGECPMTCAFCGYMGLQDNFAVQDRKTGRIVTLGSECIRHIDNDAEVMKIKGIVSLKRKVTADFKRNIHTKQLLGFLNDNLDELSAPRKAKVKGLLENNPEHYWLSKTHVVETKSGKQIEMNRTNWERTHNAQKLQDAEEFYWEQFTNTFELSRWNPKTMHPVIQKKIDADSIDIQVPKLRKLTDAERLVMNKQIQEQVDDYTKRVNK